MNSIGKLLLSSIIILSTLIINACGTSGGAETGENPTTPASPSLPTENLDESPTGDTTITGWFTIIYNGEGHYTISEENGQKTRLIIAESILQDAGGTLKFDRQKVIVTGRLLSESPREFQVQSIQLQE